MRNAFESVFANGMILQVCYDSLRYLVAIDLMVSLASTVHVRLGSKSEAIAQPASTQKAFNHETSAQVSWVALDL